MIPKIVFEDSDEPAAQGLRAVQDAMTRHPIAFQAAYSALIREGRAFAKTPEGSALRGQLASSELVRGSRLIWRILSMGAFVESTDEILPSTYLESIAQACSSDLLEPLLSRLFDPAE